MHSIQFKRTQTAGKKPTPEQLQVGEIAIQMADHVIYTKDKNNAVVQVSVSPESHNALNTKVDNNKKTTDATIAANKTEAANALATAKSELNNTITTKDTATNKRIDATNTTVSNLTQTVTANKTDADTKINNLTGTVSANKSAIETTVANNKRDADNKISALTTTVNDNNTAINSRVDTTNTNVSNLTKTVTANKSDADSKISSLTSTVAANKSAIETTVANNKKDADTKITNLTGTVNSNHTAINAKVDKNKTDTDSAIAAANRRIDGIEGSNDALYIKKNTNTKHGGYLLSKTANYLEDATARDLNYFGAFRTNGLDGLLELTLNVPHSSGVQHGRGFTFQYGHTGSRVETYGYNREGQKAFSYKMYHEGDKPTPGELNVYSKQEIDRMFVKNVKLATVPGDTVEGYFKLATAMIPQNGRSVFFRIHGGNGYNVTAYDQVDIVEIVIRSGNNRPKGVNVIAYRRNTNKSFDVLTVNTSGDNYDIYVKYQRYTDNVIVEFGKSVDVNLTVYDVPDFVADRPTGDTVIGGRAVTLFNTENKRGVLSFDDNTQNSYDIVHLSNDKGTGRKYIRKFRSNYNEMIWHETVQGSTYRLATGSTDAQEILTVESSSSIAGTHKGNILSGRMMLGGGSNVITLRRPAGQSNHIAFQDNRTGDITRQGWIGYGNADTNVFEWYSDVGGTSIRHHIDGQIELATGNTKRVYTNAQFISMNSDAYRMIYGNYGAFWRNDGDKVYLLSTDENDKLGGWNGNRPFIYDMNTGKVTLGGDGNEGALILERDSRAARFSGNAFIKGQYLTLDAGAGQSRDYFRFNHWGDSNNARDNILQLDDSKGAHFTTERTLATGAIKTKFFGDLEAAGQIRWGKGTATSSFNIRAWGADARKQVFECADESGWHWYTQRAGGPGTELIEFSINGTVKPKAIHTGGNITTNGADIEFRRSGNKHLWFRDPNGLELGLLYCDDAGIMRIRGEKSTEVWKFSAKQIHLETGTAGNGVGLLRGAVGGGAWTQWRDRGTGLQVDCQQSENSAHNVWRATHQGKYHIAAMGVHVPGGTIGNALVRLHVHDTNFDFNASGDFTAGRNGSFNDVYIRSDSRLKINKEELQDGALEKVNSLKVYSYDKVKSLSDDTVIKREVGIIAQDLEKVLPEAVGIQSTEDPEHPEAIKTISNSAVNALIIKAMQEMDAKYKAQIEALQKEIAELKATK
ncbi:phage tail fiber protein [Escherichia coli]|uniref:phage tail fiber protein n=1 Tax=Escherichia coli TaxID=562 RepID=UPI0010AFBAE8|nr:tail fiber domain-containing protein [Escherichia coli]GCJ89997.1 phage tail fiber protein [Escherichia coli]